jgi:hypothetical protein
MPASSRILVSAASVVVFVALALILTPQLRFGVHHNDGLSFTNQETAFRAPKANIWAELTDTEAADISDFLYKGPNDLNLSHKPIGNKWHNQLGLIEV